MCAGNIPSPDPDHAYKIIKAAIEIAELMEKNNARRIERGEETWEIRNWCACGAIGRQEWLVKRNMRMISGAARVNIASRMESNGIPGRVNISSETYDMIDKHFQCSHRGKIYAKNLENWICIS